jgi:hypothetical protein
MAQWGNLIPLTCQTSQVPSRGIRRVAVAFQSRCEEKKVEFLSVSTPCPHSTSLSTRECASAKGLAVSLFSRSFAKFLVRTGCVAQQFIYVAEG